MEDKLDQNVAVLARGAPKLRQTAKFGNLVSLVDSERKAKKISPSAQTERAQETTGDLHPGIIPVSGSKIRVNISKLSIGNLKKATEFISLQHGDVQKAKILLIIQAGSCSLDDGSKILPWKKYPDSFYAHMWSLDEESVCSKCPRSTAPVTRCRACAERFQSGAFSLTLPGDIDLEIPAHASHLFLEIRMGNLFEATGNVAKSTRKKKSKDSSGVSAAAVVLGGTRLRVSSLPVRRSLQVKLANELHKTDDMWKKEMSQKEHQQQILADRIFSRYLSHHGEWIMGAKTVKQVHIIEKEAKRRGLICDRQNTAKVDRLIYRCPDVYDGSLAIISEATQSLSGLTWHLGVQKSLSDKFLATAGRLLEGFFCDIMSMETRKKGKSTKVVVMPHGSSKATSKVFAVLEHVFACGKSRIDDEQPRSTETLQESATISRALLEKNPVSTASGLGITAVARKLGQGEIWELGDTNFYFCSNLATAQRERVSPSMTFLLRTHRYPRFEHAETGNKFGSHCETQGVTTSSDFTISRGNGREWNVMLTAPHHTEKITHEGMQIPFVNYRKFAERKDRLMARVMNFFSTPICWVSLRVPSIALENISSSHPNSRHRALSDGERLSQLFLESSSDARAGNRVGNRVKLKWKNDFYAGTIVGVDDSDHFYIVCDDTRIHMQMQYANVDDSKTPLIKKVQEEIEIVAQVFALPKSVWRPVFDNVKKFSTAQCEKLLTVTRDFQQNAMELEQHIWRRGILAASVEDMSAPGLPQKYV